MNAPPLGDGRCLLVVRRGDAALPFMPGHCLECMDNIYDRLLPSLRPDCLSAGSGLVLVGNPYVESHQPSLRRADPLASFNLVRRGALR